MNQTKKILLVEDEELTTQMYEEAFLKKGYRIFTVKNKKEALNKIRAEKPGLIILDLLIPSEDSAFEKFDFRTPVGLDVLKAVKTDPELKETKVVVLTNLENENVRIGAQSAGADDFIMKTDLTPDEVAEKIISKLEE